MTVLGDLFTRHRYTYRPIAAAREGARLSIRSGDFAVTVDTSPPLDALDDPRLLPAGSPFADWREARRFAGPMPHTFSALGGVEVLVVEGVREAWRPRPVRAHEAVVPYIERHGLAGPTLASAFVLEGVPHRWKRRRCARPAPTSEAHDGASPDP
jgi:hypothetical protein